MIYFDNAATTFKKPEAVYQAVEDTLRKKSGNPSRGSHQVALAANRVVYSARKKVANFFNAASEEIAFTKNATEAINLVFTGLLEAGDEVIISRLEHNAISRPLNRLAQKGKINLTVIDTEQGEEEFLTQLEEAITPQTKLIAMTHASNVTGSILPVEAVGEIAAREDIYFLVDAAQTAGVIPLDVEKLQVDFLAFTGHKALFGPQGTGGLYFNSEIELPPLLQGGTGDNSKAELNPDVVPDKYEAGTLNTTGLAGLKAGVEFIEQKGLKTIQAKEESLKTKLEAGLEAIEEVGLLESQLNNRRVGVFSLRSEAIDPPKLGYLLDKEYDIATRTGLHCAPLAHQSINSYQTGTVRVSISYFNTEQEVSRLLAALQELTG
jgi:cysteine desulfurase family protein